MPLTSGVEERGSVTRSAPTDSCDEPRTVVLPQLGRSLADVARRPRRLWRSLVVANVLVWGVWLPIALHAQGAI